MDAIDRFIKNDSFARHVGVEILKWGPGTALAKLSITQTHLNSAGTIHGGVIFSLADAAFSVASNSHGTLAMSIDVSISYFKARKEGILYADAEEVSCNPKLATYSITVKDEKDSLIALFKGTVYRKDTPIEDVIHNSLGNL